MTTADPRARRPLTLSLLPALAAVAAMAAHSPAFAQPAEPPYVLGADISWIPQREAEKVKYAHNGQARDILDILKEHKFNYIRLRLFVDPAAKVPEDKPNASGWSASPYSAAGYCGLASTVAMAKRVKDAGMGFLLDFHYSDTWADPSKQYKPVSWRDLTTLAQLAEKVRSYTKESLQAFKDAGALPDIVQVGNEVVGGMLHPDGQGNTANFAVLVNAGIKGVKDADPNIKIMMHTINERNPNGWVSTLKANLNKAEAGAADKIDVIGLSYYPMWHGSVDSLRRSLAAIANSHNYKVAVAEYADKHREVNDVVFALPANKRFGTFVWEPEEFDGDSSFPLFDWRNGRRETNARIALYPAMAKDYGLEDNNNPTGVIGGINTDKKTQFFAVLRGGTIAYNSTAPGVIKAYSINGRMLGKIRADKPGLYNPSRLLKTPLKSGIYILLFESSDGRNTVVNNIVVR